MFKKFSASDISGSAPAKTSVQRNIRKQLIEQYPMFAQELEKLWPKKTNIIVVKCRDPVHVSLYAVSNSKEPLFFQYRDGPFYPTLRLLYRYPDLLPKVIQVDRGAIKFVLKGANIMCPGITSKGGGIFSPVEEGTAVAIFAEGKNTPLAIGLMKMSSEQIKKVNEGIGMDNIHYLNDGLWLTPTID